MKTIRPWFKVKAWFRVKAIAVVLLLLVGIAPLPSRRAIAESQSPAGRPDAIALGEAIRRLGTIASALHTGAHPDDEDSGLLAYLARGRQARTAYMALTRGDGGQNLIGPELYEALGVIRTEELLAARRIDGAQQFFSRAYDFGFSKRREEALSKWDQEELLRDMVRVIRTFRPLIILPVFTGTQNDGHGHHQAAGYLTPIAYRDAADPNRFPEQIKEGLRPWKAKKLFLRAGGFQQPRTEPSKEPGVISVNTGQFDSLYGRSYYEIAMEGRSQHRSQDQGALQIKGPRYSFYKVVDSSTGATDKTGDLFDGIDVTLTGIADFAGKAAPQLKRELAEVQKLALEAMEKFNPFDNQKALAPIALGYKLIRSIRATLKGLGLNEHEYYDTDFLLLRKENDFAEALATVEGVVIDCLASDDIVTPGQAIDVTVVAYTTDDINLHLNGNRLARNLAKVRSVPVGFALLTPKGWTVEKKTSPDIPGSATRRATQHTFTIIVARDAQYTENYWLKNPRKGDLFGSGDSGTGVEPQAGQPVVAEVEVEIAGEKIKLYRPAQFRYADRAFGEIRRELKVAPAVGVNVSSNLLVFPLSKTPVEREITVSLLNNAKEGSKGSVTLDVPKSWTVTPAQAEFDLKREGERAGFTFKIKAPSVTSEGEQQIAAVARVSNSEYRQGYQVISYPHIEPRFLYSPSTTNAKLFDVKVVPNLRVGYIEGAGDDFADALRRLGVNVHVITPEELASGDLSRFDTIVTGVRVYEVRPDVVANNKRLLDYVNYGGTLIVQYNKAEYARGNFAPYSVEMPRQGIDRVTDETAKMTILDPAHPLFNAPNKITERDFDNWVQERGAYFLSKWDPHFKPLLSSKDPGEEEKQGGQVIAEYGKGLYVYTAYGWYRQLPVGVPGAYRLIANLVSLPKTRAAQPARRR